MDPTDNTPFGDDGEGGNDSAEDNELAVVNDAGGQPQLCPDCGQDHGDNHAHDNAQGLAAMLNNLINQQQPVEPPNEFRDGCRKVAILLIRCIEADNRVGADSAYKSLMSTMDVEREWATQIISELHSIANKGGKAYHHIANELQDILIDTYM